MHWRTEVHFFWEDCLVLRNKHRTCQLETEAENMGTNKDTLTVIVGGVPTEVEVNPNAALETVVEKALHQTKNVGQPKENWELKDAAGNLLDPHSKIAVYLAAGASVYLNLKAGVGG